MTRGCNDASDDAGRRQPSSRASSSRQHPGMRPAEHPMNQHREAAGSHGARITDRITADGPRRATEPEFPGSAHPVVRIRYIMLTLRRTRAGAGIRCGVRPCARVRRRWRAFRTGCLQALARCGPAAATSTGRARCWVRSRPGPSVYAQRPSWCWRIRFPTSCSGVRTWSRSTTTGTASSWVPSTPQVSVKRHGRAGPRYGTSTSPSTHAYAVANRWRSRTRSIQSRAPVCSRTPGSR